MYGNTDSATVYAQGGDRFVLMPADAATDSARAVAQNAFDTFSPSLLFKRSDTDKEYFSLKCQHGADFEISACAEMTTTLLPLPAGLGEAAFFAFVGV